MQTLPAFFSFAFCAWTCTAQAPDILQFQLNELTGTTAANTATGTTFPAAGAINTTAWQGDSGRLGFQGNEAGYGCLGLGQGGWVHTMTPVNQTGSFSIMFWLRRDPNSTSTNPFGYAFGDVSFRAFAAGGAGQGITFRGSPIGNVDSVFPVTGTPGVWQHLTLVVDDLAGQALWYDNGLPSTNVVSFTPGTFTYSGTRDFAVGAQGDSGLSPIVNQYDLDDFRWYGRALVQGEILASMASENPAASSYGTPCPGTLGDPTIFGNGVPQLGNASFTVDLANAENGRLCALALGLTPVAFGSMPLDPFLGAGCSLQTDHLALVFAVTAGNGASVSVVIPADPSFQGFHIYGQYLVAGTTGAVTPVLDINIE
ncbi:MAG: hypothetical protein KDE27_12220 [Planctomycetes bacterium]|nr:hypothetical protein [Planctomycetota bacterium]